MRAVCIIFYSLVCVVRIQALKLVKVPDAPQQHLDLVNFDKLRQRDEAEAFFKGTSSCSGTVNGKQQLRGNILDLICKKLGAVNFLVFGTGFDSPFWKASNTEGKTLFVEHHASWIGFQPSEVQKATHTVQYTSHIQRTMENISDTPILQEFYDKQLPDEIKQTQWDVILVDSPEGYN